MNDRTQHILYATLSSVVVIITTTSVAFVPSERAHPDRDLPRIERATAIQLETL